MQARSLKIQEPAKASGDALTSDGQSSDDGPTEITATAIAELLASRASHLNGLVHSVEAAWLEWHATSVEPGPETLMQRQYLDFLRQGLKDMEAILTLSTDRLCWKDGAGLTLDELACAVDMRSSLSGLLDPDEHDHAEPHFF